MSNVRSDKPFTLAGRTFQSRLLVGTGKYRDMEETRLAIEASGAEIVTVAVRRTNLGQNPGEPNLLDVLPPDRYTILPNTAGCYDAVEAVRTCRLARELLDGHNLVKLEVLADQKTLFPNVIETIKAAEVLVKDGFDVMVYTSDDPIIARQLAEIGCIAVMPLAGLIGTGLGICNPYNLRIILEESKVPVLVDAGVGTASDATIAMEMGCEAVLMNSAIAHAEQPPLMTESQESPITAEGEERQHRRIKSFVMRAGRMTEGQQRGLDQGAPLFVLPLADSPVDYDQVFGRSAPRTLEIGFGMGHSLLEMAAAAPEQDFIGVEVHRPGVGALLNGVLTQGLQNLRVYDCDAIEVLNKCVADNSLDRLMLFFPDPWHKSRHHKRRIVQPEFAELVRSKLKVGGVFHM
uniref:Thiazole synthase n=2 Tax=cellular organisms TaxID=131567 RepID=A0A1I8ABC5_9BILA